MGIGPGLVTAPKTNTYWFRLSGRKIVSPGRSQKFWSIFPAIIRE